MPSPIRHVLIIGAAGQMTRVAARTICEAEPAFRVTLADRDLATVERLAEACGGSRVTAAQLDLFDDVALREALAGVDFVILGAGPFFKTADRVMRACIEAGASYMDIDDDVESTLAALELDEAAREAGVTLYVGHGASPGLSNVLGLDLMQRLDETDDLEVAWCVGEDPDANLGRAVAEHTLHIGAGEYVGFREGRREKRESYADSTLFPMAPPLGTYRLYECAHPEPVMFGFTHPSLRNVICWGGLHPQPLNGALRGVATAVRDGRLGLDDARAFLLASTPSKDRARDPSASVRGRARAARHALTAMLGQLTSGRSTLRDFKPLFSAPHEVVVGIGARARGRRGGEPCELVARVQASPLEAEGGAMAAVTGGCEALFFQLATAGEGGKPGVAFPQAWVQPQQLYSALATLASRMGGSFHVSVDES